MAYVNCADHLIYDRKRIKSRFQTAKSFLRAASYCLREKLWAVYVDTLHSSVELAIQSILYNTVQNFHLKQTHPDTRSLFLEHCKLGNADIKFSNHYDKLKVLRSKGRYLNNLQGKDFTLNQSEAKDHYA